MSPSTSITTNAPRRKIVNHGAPDAAEAADLSVVASLQGDVVTMYEVLRKDAGLFEALKKTKSPAFWSHLLPSRVNFVRLHENEKHT
ncbi:hypothetical protein PR002_g1196 [Phytophthora rubi]|uniref:Uncharacterized protein n=1 Tax=Phytophthora rubi TaxID=129364 RepID=A0A6A3P0F3_9STRA|nr:hypothetical protein PR002_g1196 [Phytophthora rubi]